MARQRDGAVVFLGAEPHRSRTESDYERLDADESVEITVIGAEDPRPVHEQVGVRVFDARLREARHRMPCHEPMTPWRATHALQDGPLGGPAIRGDVRDVEDGCD